MPDQIYQDMERFGWNLKELEAQNLLRVICISPKLFMEHMTKVDGLIEHAIRTLKCKRMAIDSVSLLRFESANSASYRKSFYSLRNALRKFQITTLLLQESNSTIQDEIPLENYVSDGVIRLSLKSHMESYRRRTLEVLKMRGTPIMEGEHQYKITENGIHVVPSLSMIEDRTVNSADSVKTGILKLDQLLIGGISRGSTFLVDTNSKANYKYFITSIFAEHLKAGYKLISFGSSKKTWNETIQLYSLFDINLAEEIKRQRFYHVELFGRAYPEEFRQAVIDVSHLDNDTYKQVLGEKLSHIMQPGLESGEKWFVYYDLNSIISQQGSDFVSRFYSEELAQSHASGHTILSLCNFAEISKDVASSLERANSGVIRTWVDGNYQYLQLTKSPHGVVSEPLIVVNLPHAPYIQLL
jgi:circadian clock protein KaiC